MQTTCSTFIRFLRPTQYAANLFKSAACNAIVHLSVLLVDWAQAIINQAVVSSYLVETLNLPLEGCIRMITKSFDLVRQVSSRND